MRLLASIDRSKSLPESESDKMSLRLSCSPAGGSAAVEAVGGCGTATRSCSTASLRRAQVTGAAPGRPWAQQSETYCPVTAATDIGRLWRRPRRRGPKELCGARCSGGSASWPRADDRGAAIHHHVAVRAGGIGFCRLTDAQRGNSIAALRLAAACIVQAERRRLFVSCRFPFPRRRCDLRADGARIIFKTWCWDAQIGRVFRSNATPRYGGRRSRHGGSVVSPRPP